MRTRADIFRSYAAVIDMCGGTDLMPHLGVKVNGTIHNIAHTFTDDPKWFEFALGIVENRFVFEGDVLYCDDGSEYMADEYTTTFNDLSWTKLEVKPDIVVREHIYMRERPRFGVDDQHKNIEFTFTRDGQLKSVRKI